LGTLIINDPDTGVGNRYLRMAANRLTAYSDRIAHRRIFNRVTHQVFHHLPDLIPVGQ